jgi:hypothetical protein
MGGSTEQMNFSDVLNWLIAADRNKFECANGQFHLFSNMSPVTWREENCAKFFDAVMKYWTASSQICFAARPTMSTKY